MTNHIEEMMKAAGVCTKEYYLVSGEYWTRNLGGQPTKNKIYELVINVANAKSAEIKVIEDIRLKDKHSKRFYINAEKMEKYPPFTPAKQLELIKLICKSRNICELSIHLVPYGAGEDFWFQKVTYFKEQKCYKDKEPVLVAASKFENVLAELTIELIKSNELDKAEVKRILEE